MNLWLISTMLCQLMEVQTSQTTEIFSTVAARVCFGFRSGRGKKTTNSQRTAKFPATRLHSGARHLGISSDNQMLKETTRICEILAALQTLVHIFLCPLIKHLQRKLCIQISGYQVKKLAAITLYNITALYNIGINL